MSSGNEVLPSDIDADIDFSNETIRMMYARRLAPEISGKKFVENPDKTRSKVLDRSDAVDRLERIFKAMHEADQESAGTRRRRGLIDNQKRYEAVTGQPLAEALQEAAEEYHEYEIDKIAKWVIA